MVQIIQPARGGYGGRQAEKFAEDNKNFASELMQNHQQSQERRQQQQNNFASNQMASKLLGYDTSGLNEKTRDQLIVDKFRQIGAENLQNSKAEQAAKDLQGKKDRENQEKLVPLQGALSSVKEMQGLRKKGNLGTGATYSPFSSTRKDAGAYATLGKSLIQYVSSIPIRNQKEFEAMSHDLMDPNITDAYAEGVLNKMEKIINDSMSAYGGQSNQESPRSGSVGSKQHNKPLSGYSIGAQ